MATRSYPAVRKRYPGDWMVRGARVLKLKKTAYEAFPIEPKLERIIDAAGLAAAADILDIDRAQLSRYRKSLEKISAELVRRISNVEFVIDRALQVMNPEDVGPWLASPEPLLGNSIPMNILTLAGPARVIDAIDAIAAATLA